MQFYNQKLVTYGNVQLSLNPSHPSMGVGVGVRESMLLKGKVFSRPAPDLDCSNTLFDDVTDSPPPNMPRMY